MNQYPIWIGLTFTLVMVSINPNPWWWMLTALGMGANGLVVAANGWKMPVRGSLNETVRHCPMVISTRHKWLGDVIPVGFGKASIGDFLLCAGLLGVYSTRDFISLNVLAGVTILWWSTGWIKGFKLLEKWTAEARRDCMKNIPIVMVLMLAGNLLSIRGCSAGEMQASVKRLAEAATPVSIPKGKVKPESKMRDLGTIIAPPPASLRRLREETAKSEQERKKLAVMPFVSETSFRPMFIQNIAKVGTRKGPFCHVTCAVHHNDHYEAEVKKEFCNANWIPPTAQYVQGWGVSKVINDIYEYNNPWPGPAVEGFHSYKLYWSEK